MAELPAAMDLLERDLKFAEHRGNITPEHVKIALLVSLFPEGDSKELKFRYGQQSYVNMSLEVLDVAIIERFAENYGGVKDMEIDALATNKPDRQDYTNEDWVAWREFVHQEMEAFDYFGKIKKKGSKGKGKGF